MACPDCGFSNEIEAKFCSSCGTKFGTQEPTKGFSDSSRKSYVAAVCLAAIFGTLGIHHFYVGRWFHGLFDLSLLIAAGIFFFSSAWMLAGMFFFVDVVHNTYFVYKLIIGEYRDGSGKLIGVLGPT
jgi:TM2 domain-containing membrane protein YozV